MLILAMTPRWSVPIGSSRRTTSARGQGFLEYALIILFVALVVVMALSLLGPQIAALFAHISTAL